MRKLLRPRDVLLLGMAGALDVFEEIRDPFGIMARGCDALYAWVPPRYRRHNFFRLMSRQLKTGDVEKVVKGEKVYLRLTSAGKEKIVREFPMLLLSTKPWDRRWRVVIFDIEETNKNIREALRDKLRELGLGMLQESVWVTPHDVSIDLREFFESNGLGDSAFVLEVSAVLAGDQERLVRKIWNLDALEEAYREVIEEAKNVYDTYIKSSGRHSQYTYPNTGRPDAHEDEVRKIHQKYTEVLLSDPCLPKELLPVDWPARKARQAVKRLQHLVRSE